MTIANPGAETRLRQGFKLLNAFMLFCWQLGLGKFINVWPAGLGRIMVLTHTGRKTGLRRRTPVNYTIIDGQIYCTAGFGSVSDWYKNILHNPGVEVWLPEGWWTANVQEISDSPQRLAIMRQVLIASGFAARLAGINPHTMDDETLDQLTRAYRLIQVQRAAACTGPGGPGEHSWVWPLATFLLLPLALFRRRPNRRS